MSAVFEFEIAAQGYAHRRLIEYGQVLLQIAKTDEPDVRDDRPPIPKRIWTAREEARAYQVHTLILPPFPAPERTVVVVWYKAREAEYWDDIEPDKQFEIELAMCREINSIMRCYCAEMQQMPQTIRAGDLWRLRHSAIRALAPALDKAKTQELVSRKLA